MLWILMCFEFIIDSSVLEIVDEPYWEMCRRLVG